MIPDREDFHLLRKLRHPSLGLGCRPGLPGGSGTAVPALDLSFVNGETLDNRITFTRGSTAIRTNAAGVLESVAAHQPRFDYSPTAIGTLRGLLIEPQRTNVVLNATLNGSSLATQDVTVTAQAYTLSFYGAGEITLSGARSAIVTGTGAYPSRRVLTFTPSAGTLTMTVTGTVQYAQLEAGAYVTSFIPTAGSQATRSADSGTMAGAAFSSFWNAGEGTLVAEWRVNSQGSASATVVSVREGASDYLGLFRYSSDESGGVVVSGGITQAAPTASPAAVATIHRSAMSFKADDFAVSLNGGIVVIDSSGALPAPTGFGLGSLGGNFHLNGHLRGVRYYRRRLPNAAIMQMTA